MSIQLPAIPNDNRILFYKRDRALFGFLSNFHSAPIVLDGETWPTSEHYYQAQKSQRSEYRDLVRIADTPGRAKHLATVVEVAGGRPVAAAVLSSSSVHLSVG